MGGPRPGDRFGCGAAAPAGDRSGLSPNRKFAKLKSPVLGPGFFC
jgi:hypothetical protein